MQTFVLLFLFISLCETFIGAESTFVRPKHLFVQRKAPPRGSSLPHREIFLNEDGSGSATNNDLSNMERSSRARRSLRDPRSTSTDPTETLHEFKDNHHMLVVHWSGFNFSDTVVVITKDIHPKSGSTSYLYVSNNYGKTYTNQSDKLQYTKDGTTQHALIDKYYTSPINGKWYIFADITNNVLFTSKDDCKTLKFVQLKFKPSDITFHASKSLGLVAYDDTTQTLYYSNDFGSSWGERETKVVSYFWGMETLDSDNVIYLEIDNGNNTSNIIRGHYSHKYFRESVIKNVSDFEIRDVYIFATRKRDTGYDLFVGYHYHNIEKAEFPNDLSRKTYFIADTSENQVFVAVNHNLNTSHLYISDMTGKKYTLSLERILYYEVKDHKDHWLRRYMTETFVDLYAVASMRGVYLASQLDVGKVHTRKIHTVISYDKGGWWNSVNSPYKHANGSLVNCSSWHSCSLHLALQFASAHPYYYPPSIMSKSSAPGLIISSGNLGKNLKWNSNVYVSNDAGDSWLEVLEGGWYYNFADHGGIIMAVRQWSPINELRYSTDEGLSWSRYKFTDKPIHVYGLFTEPGEKTTIFTLWGSYQGYHNWLVVQVNVSNVLGRQCTESDYETWTPYHRDRGYGCILGQRLVYERRKRRVTCYNGHNYDRPINTSICRCTGNDFECDVGFREWWGFLCIRDRHASFNPYAPPRQCPPGTYYKRTQGYRKISGDKCVGGSEEWYQPYEASCPFEVDEAFLLYAESDKIKYLDLTTNNHSIAVEGLRGAVAIAYDMREGFIYWADMLDHQIMRRALNGSDQKISIAGIKQVEGMDFDWTTDNLYWVDSTEKVIEVCRKDGLFRKTVHSTDLDKPRALALDPAEGEMFWSDWGNPAKIEMSAMDGSNRKVLIKTGIVWPNGLAVDIFNPHRSRTLYYTDASKDIIGSYDLLAKTPKILASSSRFPVLQHPYSIAVDDRNVYWDDWQNGKVFKIHKSFKGSPTTLVDRSFGTAGKRKYEIKVYYKKRSQVDNSTCSGVTSCSQLCLPKPTKHNCTCGDDFEDKNGKCQCIGGLITLKNGTCKRPSGKRCASNEFACKNEYCIPADWKCDWRNDCGDWSDEDKNICGKAIGSTVSPACSPGFYRCPEGKCIPNFYVCNNWKDCEGGSDEIGCDKIKTCSPDYFRCDDGHCVYKLSRCDGEYDCHDRSDERNCPAGTVSTTMATTKRSSANDIKTGAFTNPSKSSTPSANSSLPTALNHTKGAVAGAQKTDNKKTLIWAIPVGIVFAFLLGAVVYFIVKSRRLQRSFYHLVRSDSFDQGVTYQNNGDDESSPLIQGFSDDDPLVEA